MPTIPEKAVEALKGLKNPKEQLNLAVQKAKNTITESRTIMGELKKTIGAITDIPQETIKTPFKSLNQLLHLHPINAVTELANGATNVMGDLFKITSAPARMGAASISTGIKGAKAATKLPFQSAKMIIKSPFYIWNTMERGATKVFDVGESFWNSVDKKMNEIISAGKTA